MNEIKLGLVEARFAEIIWSNEPMTTKELVSACQNELQWKRISAATNPPPKKEKPPEHDFQIKKLPQYDPDAEIASLTLTIPSWIGTIQRVRENTDFTQISKEARNRLLRQLHNMYEAVAPLIDEIREDKNNG